MKAAFLYLAWYPENRFAVDPWEFPLPKAWYDGDNPAIQDWVIDMLTYAKIDVAVMSCYFRDYELRRIKAFMDRLAFRKATNPAITLKVCVLYEPWNEPVEEKVRKLTLLTPFFQHPQYSRINRRPRLLMWRCQNSPTWHEENAWRAAKKAYGKPLWLCRRIRGNWNTDADGLPLDLTLPLNERFDSAYQYRERRLREDGALPYSITYNTASYQAPNGGQPGKWLWGPVPLPTWQVGLKIQNPAGVDTYFCFDEIGEAGLLTSKAEPFGYLTAVRGA